MAVEGDLEQGGSALQPPRVSVCGGSGVCAGACVSSTHSKSLECFHQYEPSVCMSAVFVPPIATLEWTMGATTIHCWATGSLVVTTVPRVPKTWMSIQRGWVKCGRRIVVQLTRCQCQGDDKTHSHASGLMGAMVISLCCIAAAET